MIQRGSVPLLLAGTAVLALGMACTVNDAAYRDEGQSFVDSFRPGHRQQLEC